MEELKVDIKEIKVFVIELVKQGAIHNTILAEHEKRSTSLETRIVPIEADLSFRHKLWTSIVSISGVLASIAGVAYSIYKTLN